MTRLELTLELLSDAELGTGLGSALVQGVLPRGAQGRPMVPASHLRGLLRDRLEFLADRLGWDPTLVEDLLGAGGVDGDDGRPGRLRLGDLRLSEDDPGDGVLEVTRTAVAPTGTVVSGSLRTTEALSVGRRLSGVLHLDAESGSAPDLAVRLGLRAIEAVGGRRHRGAGRCRIDVGGEGRTPGELLVALETALVDRPPTLRGAPAPSAVKQLTAGPAVWLALTFEAEAPICCPETPAAGNVLRSGPAIPASAVQGALLTRLDRIDPGLATACYGDSRFRAWPLHPTAPASDRDAAAPLSVRVDLAHRSSKLAAADGTREFRDAALEPYHWTSVAGGSPLKSADGFLLRGRDGAVVLRRAQDLPRMFQAHGVHDDGTGNRGLFTVEALAPMVYGGLVALPPEAAEALVASLERDPTVAVGKARGVRGGGRLVARPIESLEDHLAPGSTCPPDARGRVFIVQSPLAIPDDVEVGRAEKVLARLGEAWGRVVLADDVSTRTQAHCGVRFGWNRHGLGERVSGRRRLRAARVVLPGSVLVLERPIDDLAAALLAGLGGGRERGFGALLPHPGLATRMFDESAGSPPPTLGGQSTAGDLGLSLWEAAGRDRGPSASQVAALARRIRRDPQGAAAFLAARRERPNRVWAVWRDVHGQLTELVSSEDPDHLAEALRVWQDLAVGHRD